jgi:uncharacterized protein YndB with AHSA1/START domain
MGDRFSYTTYIGTSPEKLWDALIKPEIMRSYWWGVWRECDWTVGAPWRLRFPDGRNADSGEVLEFDPPRRFVLASRNARPEFAAEGDSRATFAIEPAGATVKLTISYEIGIDRSKFINAMSVGWPMIISSLKTLLESGEPLPDPRTRS